MTDTTNPYDSLSAGPDQPGNEISLKRIYEEFNIETLRAGLSFGDGHQHELFTSVFIASLATKPFVILSGISGSGKTSLATSFGQWLGRSQLLVQPVRPDWFSPEALLGYEDRSSGLRDSGYGWYVPRTLDFILKAAHDPLRPYLLVLEEMNLAHVERYFADVLSGMESGEPMVPNLEYDGTDWRLSRDGDDYIQWPKNIFIVGSINVDETTYEFSPKVLDRASVIEFRVSSLLIDYTEPEEIISADSRIGAAFLQRSLGKESPWEGRQKVAAALQRVHQMFYQHTTEFGHRVARESMRFGSMLNEMGVTDLSVILDQILVQRVITKFDTVRGFDQHLLLELAGLAAFGPGTTLTVDPLDAPENNIVLPKTLEKLRKIAIANEHTL